MDKSKKPPIPDPTDQAVTDARILKSQSSRAHSDILGSYTGTDADGEAPEQDPDDL